VIKSVSKNSTKICSGGGVTVLINRGYMMSSANVILSRIVMRFESVAFDKILIANSASKVTI